MGGREVGEAERGEAERRKAAERVEGPPHDTDHPSVVCQWFSQRFAPALLLCWSVICLGHSLVRIIAWFMSQDQ